MEACEWCVKTALHFKLLSLNTSKIMLIGTVTSLAFLQLINSLWKYFKTAWQRAKVYQLTTCIRHNMLIQSILNFLLSKEFSEIIYVCLNHLQTGITIIYELCSSVTVDT